MSSKNIWRAQMLTLRSELGPDKISQYNRDICKNLSFIWAEGGGLSNTAGSIKNVKQEAKPVWAAYKSFRWEADPAQAILDASPYIRWAYPRVKAQGETSVPGKVADVIQMEFREPLAQDALWVKNAWGIWEPDSRASDLVDLKDCKGILVPGVAFDRGGHRLGYGKGFYDRALSNFTGLKVGVGFSMQVTSESLPVDGTDVMVDIIVTDREIIRVQRPH